MLLRRILLANAYHCFLLIPIAILGGVVLCQGRSLALAGAARRAVRMLDCRGAMRLGCVVLVTIPGVAVCRV